MTRIIRSVTGMTCQHCARAVSAAVSDVPGVRTVQVDLVTATVEVSGHGSLSVAEVDGAIIDAGYGLGD